MLMCFGASASQQTMHDLPQDTAMHAYLKIEGSDAHLLVRVPLDLLHGVSWPTNHGEYAIPESRDAVNQAVEALGHALILWQNGDRLTPSFSSGQLSALSDASFANPQAALAHIGQSADPGLKIAFDLGYLDAHFIYPIRAIASVFSIQSRVAEDLQDLSKLDLQFIPVGERGTTMSVSPSSGRVALNPGRAQTALGFAWLGIQTFCTSADCLLLLACLMIPMRKVRDSVAILAAFAFANVISLAGAALGFAPDNPWFAALEAMLSALIIFLLALGNVFGAHLQRRRLWTGIFGLLWGFEFAKVLADRVQFAGVHSQVALWSLALGIDIGALLALAAISVGLALILRGARAGRVGIVVLSVIVAHAAWHWLIERVTAFWQMPWPPLTMGNFYHLTQWIFVSFIAIGVYAFAADRFERRWPPIPATASI